MRHGVLVVLGVLALIGPARCQPAPGADGEARSGPPPAVQPAASEPKVYRISSGDVLSIATWGEERFTQDCQVNGSGTISFPVIGDIRVAGITCAELQSNLEKDLRTYLKHPQVIVTVRQYGVMGMSVFVLGEVNKPGVYPIASTAGVIEALAAAGGPTLQASGEITVIKARTGEFRTLGINEAASSAKATPEAALDPGDVIMVGRKPEADDPGRYAVLGEVPTPGMFDMPLNGQVHVLDAMQKAGLLDTNPGQTPGTHTSAIEEKSRTADFEHCLLTRADVVVPLDLKALLAGDASQNLLLQAGDVLTVPRRSLVTVYALGDVRTPGRQMLPTGSTVLDLLGAVDGVVSSANTKDATIVRLVDGKPASVPVNLDRLLKRADPQQNVSLQEGDVLFVPSRGERNRGILEWLPYLPYWLRGL